MDEDIILEDGFLDLKINNYIHGFRTKYKNEYQCIKLFNSFMTKMQKEIGKKGNSQQISFVIAALVEMQKMFCSAVLLFERGLDEPGNALIRPILELSFRIIETIRNKEFVNDLLDEETFEQRTLLEDIKSFELFDILPENKIEELLKICNDQLEGKSKPQIKAKYLAKKNNLKREYVLYRINSKYIHRSADVIGDIIEITDRGVLINADLRLDNFKNSVAMIITIMMLAIDVVLKEYIKNIDLQEEYDKLGIQFKETFQELLERNE